MYSINDKLSYSQLCYILIIKSTIRNSSSIYSVKQEHIRQNVRSSVFHTKKVDCDLQHQTTDRIIKNMTCVLFQKSFAVVQQICVRNR